MDSEARASGRSGFGFLELLVLLLVASFVASVAVPRVRTARTRSIASEASQAVSAIAGAANAYHADRGDWPPEIGSLDGPGILAAYLPPGFLFHREQYELSWERWVFPGGLPPGSDSTALGAVTLVTGRNGLAQAVREALGPTMPWYTVGRSGTFIVGDP